MSLIESNIRRFVTRYWLQNWWCDVLLMRTGAFRISLPTRTFLEGNWPFFRGMHSLFLSTVTIWLIQKAVHLLKTRKGSHKSQVPNPKQCLSIRHNTSSMLPISALHCEAFCSTVVFLWKKLFMFVLTDYILSHVKLKQHCNSSELTIFVFS